MKITKTLFIVCLLLTSMVLGIIPLAKAANQDSFGYTCKDSNATGGPAYNWIEISATGNALDYYWYATPPFVNLGFSFNYYGRYYDQLNIGLGLLSVSQQLPSYNFSINGGQPIANSPFINGFMAPYWGSFDPTIRYSNK